MPSIFNVEDNAAIITRIQSVQADTPAQWGKMNAAQMLAHCIQPIRVARGELLLKRGLIALLFGATARKKYLQQGKPFEKSLPTDKNFLIKEQPDFDVEKTRLLALVRDFSEQGQGILTTAPHPFFGKLSTEEWDTLLWSHLDHHLRQFGA